MPLLESRTWQPVALSGGETPVVEPATGDILATVTRALPRDVRSAARSAAAAGSAWAATSGHRRAAVLRGAGDLLTARSEELGEWLVRESGATPVRAARELAAAARECHEAAALATRPVGELLSGEGPRFSFTRRVPVGVVGVITPVTAPLFLALRAIAPALAAGNAVVLRPDPRTAVCGGVAVAALFAAAGLPEGLLRVLPGGPEIGWALVEEPVVGVIDIAAPTAVCRAVGERAGRLLKRTHVRPVGTSTLVVLPDANLDGAVARASWAPYVDRGQLRTVTGQHLVHTSLHDAYVERLMAGAEKLTVGDPFRTRVDLGPIIDRAELALLQDVVRAEEAAGSVPLTGGTHEGLFHRPTVFAAGHGDAGGHTAQVLGPVAFVRSFSTLEEAVVLATDGGRPLSSLDIATADTARGLALAERIPADGAYVDDRGPDEEADGPGGGVAVCGTGSYGGGEGGLAAYTAPRRTTVRRGPVGPAL